MAVCRRLTAQGLTGLADVGWALSVVSEAGQERANQTWAPLVASSGR